MLEPSDVDEAQGKTKKRPEKSASVGLSARVGTPGTEEVLSLGGVGAEQSGATGGEKVASAPSCLQRVALGWRSATETLGRGRSAREG